jgi:hypothetical protein
MSTFQRFVFFPLITWSNVWRTLFAGALCDSCDPGDQVQAFIIWQAAHCNPCASHFVVLGSLQGMNGS